MKGKKTKKNKAQKNQKSKPMPSVIYSEGTISNNSTTPKADQIEKELTRVESPAQFKHLAKYNPEARKLLWTAVVSLTLVVCFMWSWSIYSQLSSIKWKNLSENQLYQNTKQNWTESFKDKNGEPISPQEQVESIKSSLTKLFAGAAASSSPVTSTPEAVTTTP